MTVMKKAKILPPRSSAAKRSTPGTIDEYLARVPEPARSTLERLRATIHSVLPAEAAEVISYGIPAFQYNGVVMWFAAFSKHCSLFPTAEVIEQFKDELKGYKLSKGTIHFPLDKPLPAALVTKMVKARLARLADRKRGPARKP